MSRRPALVVILAACLAAPSLPVPAGAEGDADTDADPVCLAHGPDLPIAGDGSDGVVTSWVRAEYDCSAHPSPLRARCVELKEPRAVEETGSLWYAHGVALPPEAFEVAVVPLRSR